jgi:hypothetical protein
VKTARDTADSELRKSLSSLDPHDFADEVSSFRLFIHAVKQLFYDVAAEFVPAIPEHAPVDREVRQLLERILNEYTKAPNARPLTDLERQDLERDRPVGTASFVIPTDKWDIFARKQLLPNKKAAVRKELARIVEEQVAYWTIESSRSSANSRQAWSTPFPQHPVFWRARRAEFDALLARQRTALGQETHPEWLKAYCDFSKESGEFGRCKLRSGFDGRLIGDFGDVATQAANALGCPAGTEPTAFWLYRLAEDLLNSPVQQIRREFCGGASCGHIQGLLESSAGYCSRLAANANRQAIEARKEGRQELGISSPGQKTAAPVATDSNGPDSTPSGRGADIPPTKPGSASAISASTSFTEGNMFELSIHPLKVRLLRDLISPEQALNELRAIAADERQSVKLRAAILDELDPLLGDTSAPEDYAANGLHAALGQKSESLRREALVIILDRITASPAMKDLRAAKRHSVRLETVRGASAETPTDFRLSQRFSGAVPNRGTQNKPSKTDSELVLAEARKAVVLPLLARKDWRRGRWATEAGVGKNCVYEYLEGKRRLSSPNRKAMAEVLGLKPEELPE